VLGGSLNRTLPRLPSYNPTFVNGFDATGRIVKRSDVDLDLTLIAAEKPRTADRAEASSPICRHYSCVFELLGSPIRIGEKRRARHLSAIGAVAEAALIWLASHGIANPATQAATFLISSVMIGPSGRPDPPLSPAPEKKIL
jgi:hypothetical protein